MQTYIFSLHFDLPEHINIIDYVNEIILANQDVKINIINNHKFICNYISQASSGYEATHNAQTVVERIIPEVELSMIDFSSC